MSLPQFKLEEYFAKYEFVAPFTMGSSDSETHTLAELEVLEVLGSDTVSPFPNEKSVCAKLTHTAETAPEKQETVRIV